MSSFGSAIVIDADNEVAARAVLGRIRSAADFDESRAVVSDPVQNGHLWRVSVYADGFAAEYGLRDTLLADVTSGRALVADDFDEYGATFTVWSVVGGERSTVYRAVIVGPAEGEWPTPAVTGEAASQNLAVLYGVEPDPLVAIDRDLDSLVDELGIIGGPFPWFDALGVAWPVGDSKPSVPVTPKSDTVESSDPIGEPDVVRASSRYEVRTRKLAPPRRIANWLMTLFQASGGEGTVPPWAHEAAVVDRSTGSTVRVVRNGVGSSVDEVGQVEAAVEQMTVEAFERYWLGAEPA